MLSDRSRLYYISIRSVDGKLNSLELDVIISTRPPNASKVKQLNRFRQYLDTHYAFLGARLEDFRFTSKKRKIRIIVWADGAFHHMTGTVSYLAEGR